MAEVIVYKFEYVRMVSPDIKWTAYIAGYTQEEATRYLINDQGNIRIDIIDRECRLDAITEPLRKKIMGGAVVENKKRGRPVVKAPDVKAPETPKPTIKRKIGPKIK